MILPFIRKWSGAVLCGNPILPTDWKPPTHLPTPSAQVTELESVRREKRRIAIDKFYQNWGRNHPSTPPDAA